MKKTLFIFSLFFVLVFSPIANARSVFQDVPTSYRYSSQIEDLVNRGVVSRNEFYRPEDKVTLEEFLTMVLRNSQIFTDNEDFSHKFNNVPLDSPYYYYIHKAAKLGLIPKSAEFNGQAQVSKFVVLRSLYYLDGIPTPRTGKNRGNFSDVPEDSYLAPYITKALDFDILLPERQDYFGISKKITRGELAYALQKVYLVRLKLEAQYAPHTSVNGRGLPKIPKIDVLTEVYDKIIHDYYRADSLKQKDHDKIMYAAIKAMVKELRDNHSSFLDPIEAKALQVSLNQELEGIGAYLNIKNDELFIVAPIKGSPAEKAGLQAGDIILEIDGEPTNTFDEVSEAIEKIKGPKGSSVTLTIKRSEKNTPMIFKLVRDKITISSVEVVFDKDKIAHLYINQFSTNTNRELQAAAKKILKQNPKGIVIDLRNNPGGYLDSAVFVLGYFLPKQTVATKIVYSKRSEYKHTYGKNDLGKYPIVILANEGSASASEIMIGALKDKRNISIYGKKTYGKGTVQELKFYQDGSSLKLTVAKWVTPNETWVEKKGFMPDVEIFDDPNTEPDEAYELAKKDIIDGKITVSNEPINSSDINEESTESFNVDSQIYSFIDHGLGYCPNKILNGSNYILWTNSSAKSSTLYISDKNKPKATPLINIPKNDFINNPSVYIPLRFSTDRKSVIVYKGNCPEPSGLNYDTNKLFRVNLETKKIETIADFNEYRSSKVLNINNDENQVAFLSSDSVHGFIPQKSRINILNLSTNQTVVIDLPNIYTSSTQKIGDGYFSPDDSQLAYLIKDTNQSELYLIIIDLKTKESKIIQPELNTLTGEWRLRGWKNEFILKLFNNPNYIQVNINDVD